MPSSPLWSRLWLMVFLVAGSLWWLDHRLLPYNEFLIAYFHRIEPQKPHINTNFKIKHIYHHGVGEEHTIHRRMDISEDVASKASENGDDYWSKEYSLSINPEFTIRRLSNRSPEFMDEYLEYAAIEEPIFESLDWVDEPEIIPNITDKQTVLNLALMASNAYVEIPGTGDWTDVAHNWSNKSSYGWLEDGIRGHVFANEDESIVVISIKGTTAAYVSSIDPLTGDKTTIEAIDDDPNVNGKTYKYKEKQDTVNNDKINDNLLFSCCCARVSYLWTTVCDCYKSSYTCDSKCLENEIRRPDRYYSAVLDLYRNVTTLYPSATIWVTGHSLGGSLSSLLGRTYGLPVVTYQAPGDLLPTKRLHLPLPPGLPSDLEHVWHFGNTGDPIFMGVCNGASSTCSLGGYAMESQCHSGKSCVYDTVADLGWSVSIYNHRIHAVIDNVISFYNETAPCRVSEPCVDCFNWNYVSDNENHKYKPSSSVSLTSTSTSRKKTENPTSSTTIHKCARYNWLGRCVKWEDDDNHT